MIMTMGDSVQRYPLLRLLVPYICGVGIADVCYSYIGALSHILVWGVLFLLLLLALAWIWRSRVAYGISVSALFLMLGVWGYVQARGGAQYHWSSGRRLYEARVLAEPRARQRSVMCEMEVLAVCDSSVWKRVDRKVLVYMERSDEALGLLPGDILCFEGTVRAPRNFSDSLGFDYARYVTMQGAAGTVYLSRNCWRRVGEDGLSLREHLLRLRHKLQVEYLYRAFDGDALGVLSALTLGDKRGLSEEVRAAYTDSGAAHVLALSGLHVGVIYAMLAFLMRGVLRRRGLRWVREVLTIAILWLFALMVGLSASVVRAVGMCTLYILSRWVSRDSNSINVLLLAALVMLLVHPLYLFDVGFQLSFMAMVSILWLEPYLEVLFRRRSLRPIPSYCVGVVCMSLAAQLGTFPLTLYHFGTFSTYFLLTNLVVIPYLYVVLLLTVAWWALVLMELPWAIPLGAGIQLLVGWVNDFLAWIGRWPGAVLHVGDYTALEVFFTYLFVLFAGLFFVRRWARGAVLALASLLALLLAALLPAG